MKLKYALTCALLCLLVSLSGCILGDRPSTSPQGDAPGVSIDSRNTLDGSSWSLYAFRKSRPIDGTSFTITFDADQVHGNAGCNQFFGSYSIDEGQISFSGLGMTEMACMDPEGLMEQEQFLLKSLGESETYELSEGRLILYRGDGETLTFDRVEE